MASYDEIATRWLDVALGKAGNKRNYSFRHDMRVFGEGNVLYSYGRHFPLVELLRDPDGEPRLLLLNGDNYSVSTTRHQGIARNVCARSGLPMVIIPFSAMEAAGIWRTTVDLVDVTADRHEEIKHRSLVRPEGSRWVTRDHCEYVDLTPEEIEAKIDARHALAVEEWTRGHSIPGAYWVQWQKENPKPPTRDSIVLSEGAKREYRKTGEVQVLLRGLSKWATIDVSTNEDGETVYQWTTHRHWLGESLVRAQVTGGRTAYFLSGFDMQERRPLYFFCELPQGVEPNTVADAYEDLKPQAVKLAEQMNRPVVRQGDIFAIALNRTTKRDLRKQGATFVKRGTLLNTNHVATETAHLPDGTTLARGMLYHAPQWREPDHARRKLPDGWCVAVKNTVPVAA